MFLVMFMVLNVNAAVSRADMVFIAHSTKKEAWTEKQVRDLYLGILKLQKVDLLDQAAGQDIRDEFYQNFLKKTESQLKQQWSILIFSGERVPQMMANDRAVYDYVKSHANAVGYVSSAFWDKEIAVTSPDQPIKLFLAK